MDKEKATLTFLCCFFFSILSSCDAVDTIVPDQPLLDGNYTVSSQGIFEMGFFSPDNSNSRYFGIWYKIISAGTIVWVANRDSPLNDTNGALHLSMNGNLIVSSTSSSNNSSRVVWSSSTSTAKNPVAQLLDTGNLVVRESNDENPENYLWQSFDHPCDTALPGLKMGKNLVTGINRVLTSWKSSNDPGTGNYSFLIDSHGFPQPFLMENGSHPMFRSGPWNGERFSGSPGLKPNPVYTYGFVFDDKEIYYIFHQLNSSVFTRLVMNTDGVLRRLTWNSRNQMWTTVINAPADSCDKYGLCGGYGSCNMGDNPLCSCLDKFRPKEANDWAAMDWLGGCVRKTELNCRSDGFVKYPGVKLPDTRTSWYNRSMSVRECEERCLRDCSCNAYSRIDVRGDEESGCLLWFDDLMDLRNLGEDGQDIYIRMASSELGSSGKKMKIVRICLGIFGAILLLCLIWTWYTCKKKKENLWQQELSREGSFSTSSRQLQKVESTKDDVELPLFDLATILKATNHFSINNKIGEGGFGPVYKGSLREGQEIAVKRLSKYSEQGLDEFKNEVILITKLQHRNLVKLLGCCIEGEEKMLIYEFMPNNSLDSFIFAKEQSRLLDWPRRFHIINGIARGMLYLHQDSRLRIIHRDLKAANVLLDDEMNPKISDFGMARSFGGNESEAKTRRVVGTYGYMSPEYAVDGDFSVKSDVFSFGVLVLEIISGSRNRGFFHPDHHHNLLGHAWILHNEGCSLELMEEHLSESCHMSEILRSIHVGLLCVQMCPEDRPSMSNVVLMLGSEGPLGRPKEPGFFTERNLFHESQTSSTKPTESNSGNELSITVIEAR